MASITFQEEHTTADGIWIQITQLWSGVCRYWANGYAISRAAYYCLRGSDDSPTLVRETDCCGNTTYLADDFPVSEKIYKAMGGKPVDQWLGCDIHGTAYGANCTFAPPPKPKTRGEEAAEKGITEDGACICFGEKENGRYQHVIYTPTDRRYLIDRLRGFLADTIDREIAAAEKRGEERGASKAKEDRKGILKSIASALNGYAGVWQRHPMGNDVYGNGYARGRRDSYRLAADTVSSLI